MYNGSLGRFIGSSKKACLWLSDFRVSAFAPGTCDMSDDLTQTQDKGGEGWRRARAASQQRPQPPTQVPGYEIESCLGEGAYGEVWAARDLNNPSRRVAIKFYTRQGGDWALLAREVEKLNFLATDRYVVQLLDVGWKANPPYYVMEFVEKGSLAERLKSGPLPVAEALSLFGEIVRGVVHAHNRGVLHCDLKPANILLGMDGKPRLADFGQSRLTHELTPALGTLFYMAPEQADLKAAPDARWDVYALGAVLYCLLTGQPPHQDLPGVEALERSMALEERLARYRQMLGQAHRPRNYRRLPGVDRALAQILERCLAINPTERYPNVQALFDALAARALRRARRPLVVMGAVGPVLWLLLLGFMIREELVTAVRISRDALTDEARVGNQFAAQAVAEKVAGKIDRRWRTLEQEAARSDFQALLKAAQGTSFGAPPQRAVQARLEAMHHNHPEVAAEGWAVFDAAGSFLARSPFDERAHKQFIGKNYAHRGFFSGLNKDLDETAPAQPPLLTPHRSNVFLSKLTKTRKVAFSVPVWNGPRTTAVKPRLGVLMMTVNVGSFAEIRAAEVFGEDFFAVLVDNREDADGRKGAILEHPRLAQLRRQKVTEQELQFYVDPQGLEQAAWDTNYNDPLSAIFPSYQGRWLAARQRVLIDERPEARDPNWTVIVQERYDAAIGPVLQLQAKMVTRGWWALGLALSVVTALWLFVLAILNESPSSRLVSFLKRRAGVRDSATSQKGPFGRSQQAQPPGTAAETGKGAAWQT
jgi:hypothetical protein